MGGAAVGICRAEAQRGEAGVWGVYETRTGTDKQMRKLMLQAAL